MLFNQYIPFERLWKIYARVIWGDWGEVGSYSAQGFSHPVIWVQSSKWMAGQYMLGGIFLNKMRLRDSSKNLLDYVFLHEYGHGQPPFLFRILSVTAQLILLPLTLAVAIALPAVWLMGAVQLGPSLSLVPFSMGTVLGLAIVLIPLMTVRWLDEGYAEVFAASELGVDNYRDARREMREISNPSILKLVLLFVLYPPTRLVSRIAAK